MTKIRVHEGDRELYDIALYDRTGAALTTDDITAVTFVATWGDVDMTSTLGSGVTKAVVSGVLTITVELNPTKTETLSSVAASLVSDGKIKGKYQCRVTRGSIGPETVAEGVAEGILKIEGD